MKAPTKPPTAALRDYRDHIPYLLGAIANILSSGGSRLYQEAFGISLAEWRLMWVLWREAPLTAVRAAEIMGVDKGAVSRALSGLERRGFVIVAVHPTDRRQRTIELSDSGVALYGRVNLLALERERRLFSAFTAEELRVLRKLLRRLHAHAPSVDAIDAATFTRSKPLISTARQRRGSIRPNGRGAGA
jgi:DNA-binding MarR family transcriptional regulator